MKILVCGSGVIGSLLIHTLLQNNNEVTVLARGKRREELEIRTAHEIPRKKGRQHRQTPGRGRDSGGALRPGILGNAARTAVEAAENPGRSGLFRGGAGRE